MSGLLILLAVFLGFAVVSLFALTLGVDSRPEFDDRRAPERGLTS